MGCIHSADKSGEKLLRPEAAVEAKGKFIEVALKMLFAQTMVVYVIPYTSIIEQNAQVFRDILGAENVLEHHSGVPYDVEDEAAPENVRLSRAVENWDMPVVITTAVQLFESLFAYRSSQCRKLHNLEKSVIIFDEAQMLPVPYLRPWW